MFAKSPRLGFVKTRLSPPLSPEQCVELYDAMLADVLEASLRFAAELDLDPILAFHPPDAVTEMLSRAPAGYRLHPQRGDGLAERMANAFAEAAAAGARSVLLRGSDSPGLKMSHVRDMLAGLEAGMDLVFTPDQGGGYAMIGMQTPRAEVFAVPMSTVDMLEKSIAVAKERGLRTSVTSPAFDLDTVADFSALDELSAKESSDLCPRTVNGISHLRSLRVL